MFLYIMLCLLRRWTDDVEYFFLVDNDVCILEFGKKVEGNFGSGHWNRRDGVSIMKSNDVLNFFVWQMVWPREGLQCFGHGPPWPVIGRFVQLLLS